MPVLPKHLSLEIVLGRALFKANEIWSTPLRRMPFPRSRPLPNSATGAGSVERFQSPDRRGRHGTAGRNSWLRRQPDLAR
jgi:hypothetical protein